MAPRSGNKLLASLVLNKVSQSQTRCFSKFDMFSNLPIPPNKQKYVPESGTYPKGFLVGSINIGIKPSNMGQPDLILIASERPSCGAAVFTKNEFPAASITVSRELVWETKGRGLRGIIAAGLEHTAAMSSEASKYVSDDSKTEDPVVMVMHTGIGGER